MAKEFVTINMQVPTFTDDMYHMTAVLVDCQGNTELIELGPDTVFRADEHFAPCGECGCAVLITAWYGNGNADCCARCGITSSDTSITTREEAEDFLAGCINLLRGGFHADTLGYQYVNGRTGERLFTDEEAATYDKNMAAAFSFFEEGSIYAWCVQYASERLG